MSNPVRKILFDLIEDTHDVPPMQWPDIVSASVERLKMRAKAGDFSGVEPGDRERTPLDEQRLRATVIETVIEARSRSPQHSAEWIADEVVRRSAPTLKKFLLEIDPASRSLDQYTTYRIHRVHHDGRFLRCIFTTKDRAAAEKLLAALNEGSLELWRT